MLISTKGRYALRVMADLAANDPADGSFVPLRDVAERQGISQKYLESIFSLLSRADAAMYEQKRVHRKAYEKELRR